MPLVMEEAVWVFGPLASVGTHSCISRSHGDLGAAVKEQAEGFQVCPRLLALT